MQFSRTVAGFYAKNFFRYSGGFVFLYMVLAVIDTAGLYLLPPFFIEKTISVLENTPATEAFAAMLPVALVYLVLRGAQWGASVLRWTVFDNTIKYKSYNRISADLYDYVFKQSIGFYSDTMPGKINSQINHIAESYFETVEIVCGGLVATVVTFFVSGIGLFDIGWQYFVLISLAIVFRIGWGVLTTPRVLRAGGDRAKVLNKLQGGLLDAVSNFMVVKLFANADKEQKIANQTRKDYEKTARLSHCWSRFSWAPGNLFMDTICFSALLLLCGYMVSIGQSTIAQISFVISVYVAMAGIAFNLVMTIKNFSNKWSNAVGSYEQLIQPILVQDVPNAPNLKVRNAEIQIQKLWFKYRNQWVLQDLNLDIRVGEKVGIVGLSGAGKTTLVNLLMRFYDPTHGKIMIGGTDIKTVRQDSLRRNIAFVPQDSTMFNRSLRGNIAYGNDRATEQQIRHAAQQAFAHDFIMSAPEQYDTLVGDRGIKLSGGQRQRIAIARAFLKDAPILILDEATAALDSETESVIQKSFAELSVGRTTIAIAHRLSTLRNMDRIVVLDKGKIVEQGSHKALLRKKSGLYAKLWKMQSDGFLQE